MSPSLGNAVIFQHRSHSWLNRQFEAERSKYSGGFIFAVPSGLWQRLEMAHMCVPALVDSRPLFQLDLWQLYKPSGSGLHGVTHPAPEVHPHSVAWGAGRIQWPSSLATQMLLCSPSLRCSPSSLRAHQVFIRSIPCFSDSVSDLFIMALFFSLLPSRQ